MSGKILLYVEPLHRLGELNFQAPRKPFTPRKKYRAQNYEHYANYDGIDVTRTADIPCTYSGIMGVPVSFLNVYNSRDFQILGVGIVALEPPHANGKNTQARPKHLGARILVRYLCANNKRIYPVPLIYE